jgi:hypothetical protein
MKKAIFASAILLAVLATSCGTENTESASSDSTAVVVDSSACCQDTSAIVVPVDTNRESAEPEIDNPN